MNENETHGVLIVEDDPRTREHFCRAVALVPSLFVLAAVGCIQEAEPWLKGARKPDVMLVDLGLPDGNGIDLIRTCRKQSPATLVLVITVFAEESKVIASVRAGASGYLLKDGLSTEIAQAITAMIEGGSPLSASVARYVLRMAQSAPGTTASAERDDSEPLPQLTKREIEILEIIGRGFTSAEAAHMLKLSVHTVTAHTRSIHRKLEVSSRAEAIFEAVARGLIRLAPSD